MDVIKSGGYKISALDIEKELLAHPQIEDVAVMGISDPVWGQRIFSLLVLKPEFAADKFNKADYTKWCKERLPVASVPTLVKIIDQMPRVSCIRTWHFSYLLFLKLILSFKNQLGKVNKKELIKKYEAERSFI